MVHELRTILFPLRTIAERWKLLPYAARQTYQFSYRVQARNPATTSRTALIVCPLPPILPYQQVRDVRYRTKPDGSGIEPRYHNRFDWWNVELPPGGSAVIGYDATVSVNPRAVTLAAGLPLKSAPLSGDRYFEVTEQVKELAAVCARGAHDQRAYVARCYAYVITHLRYGEPISGLYRASEALRLPQVDCGGFATLLGALLLARGIPVRLVVGFWAGYAEAGMHAWLECDNGSGAWAALDPSVEQLYRNGRTWKSGRKFFVGSDRVVVSLGADLEFSLAGQKVSAPLLQHPLVVGSLDAAHADVAAVRV
ncbi:MAG: transglutaminase domain-containing protein [bacterium]|nr:transglutaminase domain-containing protein [bacterium]